MVLPARQSAPKLILLYIAPWDLNYGELHSARRYEGLEMLFRHGAGAAIRRFVLKDPFEVGVWLFQTYAQGRKAALSAAQNHEDRFAAVARTKGLHKTVDIQAPCTLPGDFFGRGFSSVQSLIKRYSAKTKVLVYLAPVPACENVAGILERSYAGVSAASPKV